MPTKICKKHKKPFYGLRCPICTAPPAMPDPDEKLPFATVDYADAELKVAATHEGPLDTETPTSILQIQTNDKTPRNR